MFSRRLLSCHVSPSDRGHPVHSAWSDRKGCPSCCQRFPTLNNPSAVSSQDRGDTCLEARSGVEVGGKESGGSETQCGHILQSEEDVVVSASSVSPPPSLGSSLTVLLSGSSVCEDLDWLLQHDQSSTLLLSLCGLLSPPFCKRCVSCPLLWARSSDPREQSSAASSPSGSSSGRSGSCAAEFSECGCTRDVLNSSSASSPSCLDCGWLSASLSSSSLGSSTSSWCSPNEERVEQPVPTSSAFSSTTTTITTTRVVGKPACRSVSSPLPGEAVGAVWDIQPAVGVGRLPDSPSSLCGATSSVCGGSVAQCPYSDELSRGVWGFSGGVLPVSVPSPHRLRESLPSDHQEPSALLRQGSLASGVLVTPSAGRQRPLSRRHQGFLSRDHQGSLSAYQQGSKSSYQPGSQVSYHQGLLSSYHQGLLSAYQQGSQVSYQQGSQSSYQQGSQSHHQGSLSSPRGDSDSDAQIDSMSSSDLDHCEDLQPFELAQLPPDHQPLLAGDGPPHQVGERTSKDVKLVGRFSDPSLNGHKVHMMSYQDFEQLPAMPEDCELPALWEDGGALGSDREGYNVGANYGEDGIPPWGSAFPDSGVSFLPENAESVRDTPSLEHRSNLIEQTLSEIYASPFQQLMYASSQSASTNHKSHPAPQQQRKTSLRTADSADPSGGAKAPKDFVGDNEENLDSHAKEEGETLSDDDGMVRRREEPERVSLGHDVHRTMKVSIARAAQKAVSGYRTCDDADSYVGARVKPTLILARAPPSPSGILRRTNKKTSSAKVAHGTVRWADGKPPSLPPTDEPA